MNYVDSPVETGPYGPGSLAIDTADANDASKVQFLSNELTGTSGRPLSDLTDVNYMARRDSSSTGNVQLRPTVQLPVYRNIDGPNTNYDTLVFEPQYCYTLTAADDNKFETFDGDHQQAGTLGCFHYSHSPDTYYKTLADAQAAAPDATLLQYGFGLGSYQPGTLSNVDALSIAFNDGTTVYNFEKTPPPPPLTATISDGSVTEGNSGTTPENFTVTLNRPSLTDTVIHYTTNDGSASVADNDYQAKTGDLTIPAGSTTGTITVQINGDTKVEPDEVFHVRITSTDADVSGSDYATGNILNDDTASPPKKPYLKVQDATTVEGNSGTHNLRFRVRLSKKSTSAVTVRYTTADGSATAGSDYVAKTGMLAIPAGSTFGVITVRIKGDRLKEPSESFFVTLSGATNATIADPNATGVIQNDD